MRLLRNIDPSPAEPASFSMQPLESRRLLSAGPWSVQDQLIGLDQATQNYPNLTGTGETVAIIDRGVDYNHPELGGGFGPGFKIVAGYNFQDNNGDVFPYDNDAHGTGTAGQIAAAPHVVDGLLYQGVAPGVNIVALKTNGTADIKAALDWILGHRDQYNIVAVNYLDKSGADVNSFVPQLQALTDAGVFIAGATGNYGPATAYPSVNHLIHLVGSVDLNDQLSAFTPRGPAVDLVAPAGGINITWYDSGQHEDSISSGTSWAAPQVVGTAALIKQINPNFNPAQILAIIRDSAQQVWDPTSGLNYPELNVNAALGLAYQRSGTASSAPAPAAPAAPATPAAPIVTTVTPPPQPAPPVLVSISPGTPFSGTPFSIGRTIQAEHFDNGGEGISFHAPSVLNSAGDAYRPGTVDLAWTRKDGHSWALGRTQPGEWLNYSLKVGKSGTYDLTARVASIGRGGTFHFEVDGVDVTGAMSVPDTHGWDRYVNVAHRDIALAAGTHVVKLVIDQAGSNGFAGNMNWFKFTPAHRHVSRHRAATKMTHAAIARPKKQIALPRALAAQ